MSERQVRDDAETTITLTNAEVAILYKALELACLYRWPKDPDAVGHIRQKLIDAVSVEGGNGQ